MPKKIAGFCYICQILKWTKLLKLLKVSLLVGDHLFPLPKMVMSKIRTFWTITLVLIKWFREIILPKKNVIKHIFFIWYAILGSIHAHQFSLDAHIWNLEIITDLPFFFILTKLPSQISKMSGKWKIPSSYSSSRLFLVFFKSLK